MAIGFHDVEAAAKRIAEQVQKTAFLHSQTLSRLARATVFLKFENQQFTASFKERGALNALLQMPEAQRAKGVLTFSAGNHAQAIAHHARRLGAKATVIMPCGTPNSKVEKTTILGAEVILRGGDLAESQDFAEQLAAERGACIVHPYDEEAVIAGQGTMALEMLQVVPDLDAMIIPVGGGGLISGSAIVAAHLAPNLRLFGVEADRFASAYQLLKGEGPTCGGFTIAEGIAVKRPGQLTGDIMRQHVTDILLVNETNLEEAVITLLEIEKTVVEGAGAAGLAALLRYPEKFRGLRVGLALCGGNIDMVHLSSAIQRSLFRTGRLVRLQVELPDMPGALGNFCMLLGELNCNIIEIVHQRTFSSSIKAVSVEVVVQLLNRERRSQLVNILLSRGYRIGTT